MRSVSVRDEVVRQAKELLSWIESDTDRGDARSGYAGEASMYLESAGGWASRW